MSADWQAGDLVVCLPLRLSTCNYEHECDDEPDRVPTLVDGRVYRVIGYHPASGKDCASLSIEGLNNDPRGWCAGRFRRVEQSKLEPCEEEFVTLLKRTKRTVQS